MKKAFAFLALGVVALAVVVVVVCGRDADDAVAPAESASSGVVPSAKPAVPTVARPARPSATDAKPERPLPTRRLDAPASRRVPRAKEALIALFAVKPGEMPPELPPLTLEERNLLPMIIENELTDADGCDAAAIRREFRLYMEFGGNHADFLPAYRRKLLKRLEGARAR